jgi:3-hydroxy-3-methylglutaryl CoA synthase
MTAITSRGRYLPGYRVSTREIRDVHGGGSDGVKTKAVQAKDDDVTTLALAAARDALDGDPDVDAVHLATTTPVYAYGSVMGAVVESLGLPETTETASYRNTPRAATAALRNARDAVGARDSTALVVATDAPTPATGTDREKTAGAGAAALLLEPRDDGLVPVGDGACTRDLLDEWEAPDDGVRRSGDDRFARDVGYVETSVTAAESALADADWDAADVDALVCNHPNPKFPGRVARSLGTADDALVAPSFASDHGDLGSASAPAILARADLAEGDRVLACSYGTGTADALAFRVEGEPPAPASARDDEPIDLSYVEYLQHTGEL